MHIRTLWEHKTQTKASTAALCSALLKLLGNLHGHQAFSSFHIPGSPEFYFTWVTLNHLGLIQQVWSGGGEPLALAGSQLTLTSSADCAGEARKVTGLIYSCEKLMPCHGDF